MKTVAVFTRGLVIVQLCASCGTSGNGPASELADSGTHGSDASVPTIPESKAEFAQRVSEVFCTNLQHCCGDSTAFVASGCQAAALADAAGIVADPLIQYDSLRAGDCLATIDAATRECYLGTLSFEIQWEPCNRAFVGTLPRGAACTDTRQCARVENGAVTCAPDVSPDSDSSVCLHYLPPPRGTLGTACNCTMGESNSCAQIWNATGPSDDRAACYAQDGLYCDERNGICKSIGGLGEACQIYYPSCTDGLFCADDETCHPIPGEGESCAQSVAVCETGLTCRNGRCAPPLELGEQCNFLVDRSCTTGSHCSAASNTCVPPEPLGAACWSDSDCISGHCPLGADTGFAASCIANPLSDEMCAAISG